MDRKKLILLLGALIGVGIAVLRHTLDTSVKSTEDLEAAADSTPLGTVIYDPDAGSSPLVGSSRIITAG